MRTAARGGSTIVVSHPCEKIPSQGWGTRRLRDSLLFVLLITGFPVFALQVVAQEPAVAPAIEAGPIAIVPLDSAHPDQGAKVTGALEVSQGKAVIVASGAVTSGSQTTQVTLPRRGVLRVCASTTVSLAADTSVPAGETPGLMMSMDHGAVEASFATGRNSDILLTPDFRILIGGPGAAEVKVRLGQDGDTCVDNAGVNAPYVLVTSVFDGSDFRVQPGQRVMFERGSLHDVVDNEKEPCGCPPGEAKGNEFPLAQSEGLAPTPKPAPNAMAVSSGSAPQQGAEPLVYKSKEPAPQPVAEVALAPAPETKPPVAKKRSKLGQFFRKLFGAE